MRSVPTGHEARVRCIACGSCVDGSLPIVVTASSEGLVFVRGRPVAAALWDKQSQRHVLDV